MEFKKIPASAPVPQQAVDPDAQVRQTLRVMASRQLYGARGLLFLVGSILLVVCMGMLFSAPPQEPGVPEVAGHVYDRWQAGLMGRAEWLRVADAGLAVFILLCGALVTRLPLTLTVLPAGLLVAKACLTVGLALSADRALPLLVPGMQLLFAGLCLRAVADARAYRRDAALALEYHRSAAILRMKEARERE